MLVAGLVLATSASAQINEAELLMPHEAFRLNASAGADALRLEWIIADGYYLYRSKFRFRTNTPGIVLAEAMIPPGTLKEDEFFGRVEIFRERVAVIPSR